MGWPPEIGETLPRSGDAWCEEQKWTAWIMADHGHHSEWTAVLRVGGGEWERAWEALREAVKEATIETVRFPATGGVTCGVTIDVSIGERSAPVTSAWHYEMQGAAPRLVTAYPTPYNRVHGGDA
jgi:hypothetical protein